MRKLIVFNMVTVDGYFAGTKGEIDWHHTDDEFNEFAISMLQYIDTILFGRITYEMMASYWSSAQAPKENPDAIVRKMNTVQKIVFSTTMDKANWNNTILFKERIIQEVQKLKSQKGSDMVIFGSGTIVQQLSHLIDEYRLMVNPLVLGKGKSLFREKMELKFLQMRQFKNGNILLQYQRKNLT